jgi:hypothetical protein
MHCLRCNRQINTIFIRRSGTWLARAITSLVAPAFIAIVRMRTLTTEVLQSTETHND